MDSRHLAPPSPWFFKSSMLLLLAFATVFLPRLLTTFGAPAALNFVHFAIVPLTCGFALSHTRIYDRAQRSIVHTLLAGLGLLLAVGCASALLNQAGVVNVWLDFLLLAEPLLLLVAFIALPMSTSSIHQFRTGFILLNGFHLLLALIQRFVFNLHHDFGMGDNIQGVFYRSGGGHVVGSAVSLTFCVYYFLSSTRQPRLWRGIVLAAGIVHLLVADAKQVLFTFMVGFAGLLLLRLGDGRKALLYLLGGGVFLFGFGWAIEHVAAFSAFKTWMRPELFALDGEATRLKLAGIQIVLAHYQSPLQWLLGLGPGHSIDRLGGWMLRDYRSLLLPLGATTSPVGAETWQAVSDSWLGPRSSFFSPFFSWAGLWGDLGLLGLGIYLLMGIVIWRQVSRDDFSRLVLLTVVAHGFIFTQLEEPGYMLFVACLLGLRWQEQRQRGDDPPIVSGSESGSL